ncbi:MAG: tRNA threonylcarbamoyladenosine dehydratase [Ruminococcaceae bacterium]|nr:tRNA threonylcarbamoyladenosine dehydratase [Oscillospiraceae bacterium]
MDLWYQRTEQLFGSDNINKLKNARVAVFGIGGVGGYAVEGLARTGIGAIDLIDDDTVSITNLNRQIIATHNTLGTLKTEAAKERILSINPEIDVMTHNLFYNAETAESFDLSVYDYVIDAIDTVSAKLELISRCETLSIPIISSMGTGNKLDATKLVVTDIFKTSVCPLARVMRYELKKRGIKKLKVVYSKEEPMKPTVQGEEHGRHIPASAVFVPAAAGFILASEVVKDIIG